MKKFNYRTTVNITDDLAVDFTVATQEGCERIARLAYEYAKKNNKGKVSIITKANIIKTTDGKFLNTAKKIGEEYETPPKEYVG